MIRCGSVLRGSLSLPFVFLSACDSSDPLSGIPASIAIEVQPRAPAPSGAAFAVQPVVQLVDHNNEPVREEGHQIVAGIAEGPDDSAWLSHAQAVTDNTGSAHFRALAISGNVGTYRLDFGGVGLDPTVSAQITVSTPITGSVVDAEGDIARSGADLLSATLTVVGGDSLSLVVRWVPGSFVRDTSIANIFLDSDQDVGTGHPGISSTGSVDGELIGADYLISVGPVPGDNDIQLYVPSHTTPSGVNIYADVPLSCHLTYESDGFSLVMPLAALGNEEDGIMNFKLGGVVKLSDTGYSGWLDVVPDVGEPAGRVQAGG